MTYNQVELLRGVDSRDIPSTVDFPLEKILKYLPYRNYRDVKGEEKIGWRGLIWDMGFGSGRKSLELHQAGFTVGGYDINPAAVGRFSGFFGVEGDVTHYGTVERPMELLSWLEMIDALLYQAVFPSLLGDRWKDALEVADMFLRPGQYLFIADFVDASRLYPELVDGKGSFDKEIWERSQASWLVRYRVNQAAFADLGIGDNAFAVGKPGPLKEEYDWCDDPKRLRFYYDQGNDRAIPPVFERFARHLDLDDFGKFILKDLGYELVERKVVKRPSRLFKLEHPQTVTPGFEWVFRKPGIFRYDPWKAGIEVDDLRLFDIYKERKHAADRGDLQAYWTMYLNALYHNVRPSQKPSVLELAKLLGIDLA